MKVNNIRIIIVIEAIFFSIIVSMILTNVGCGVCSKYIQDLSKIENERHLSWTDAYRFPPEKYFQINSINDSRTIWPNVDNNFDQNNQNLQTLKVPYRMGDGPMDSSWPTHGYDMHHTGRSPYSTINTSGVEKWRFNANYNVEGTAVIDHNGTIYFGSNYPNFYAIYPNGTQKWCKIFGSFICMFGTSPALDENGTIYVPTGSGLVALYSSNGSTKWSYGGDVESSPVVGDDGTVYFGLTSGAKGYVVALYSNGTERWKYQTGHVVYSSPAIGLDGMVYCGSHDGNLYAFYPDNGTVKWAFGTGGWVHGSPAVAEDGTVYIGSDSKYLYALYPNNGTMKWKVSVGSMRTSPSQDKNGALYFGVWEHRLYAVYPNGTIKWSIDPGNSSGVWGSTAAISDDETIYFGITNNIDAPGYGGDIIALNLDGTEQWRKRIADSYTFSSPSIAEDGTVYIGSVHGTAGHLHAFGPGEQKNIQITNPQISHIYLFGKNLCSTLLGNTYVLGNITIKLEINGEDKIEGGISFYLENRLMYTDTEPPYEWNMDKRYAVSPIFEHRLTVAADFQGGCQWNQDIIFWHFTLRMRGDR